MALSRLSHLQRLVKVHAAKVVVTVPDFGGKTVSTLSMNTGGRSSTVKCYNTASRASRFVYIWYIYILGEIYFACSGSEYGMKVVAEVCQKGVKSMFKGCKLYPSTGLYAKNRPIAWG